MKQEIKLITDCVSERAHFCRSLYVHNSAAEEQHVKSKQDLQPAWTEDDNQPQITSLRQGDAALKLTFIMLGAMLREKHAGSTMAFLT